MRSCTLILAGGLLTASASAAFADKAALTIRAGELGVVVVPGAGAVGRRAAELLVRQARERSGVEVRMVDEPVAAGYTLTIRLTPSPATGPADRLGEVDDFRLTTKPDVSRRLELSSPTPSGLVAGIGQLMRASQYRPGSILIPQFTMHEKPAMPVRGMYFATHFGNFYDAAPLDEIDRVIEDLALWGTNQLVVWFDMHHFKSFDDPRGQAHLKRLRHMGETAHALGMKFGILFLANEGYAGSPEHLRAKYRPFWSHYHVEICPSNPEGLALIGREQERVLRAFDKIDVTWSWPYDQGGCCCDKCMPWGGNGFIRASRQLADIYHRLYPAGQFWVSTWLFDAYDDSGRLNVDRNLGKGGDYEGMFRFINQEQPAWFEGFIMGTPGSWIPEPLLKRPQPERYPLTSFPEISMYNMNPWGGFGANPLPKHLGQLAERMKGQIVGGWPYSEGIFEDFNKFLFARYYWNPGKLAPSIAREYASYYFGPDVAEDTVRLFDLLESTHPHGGWTASSLAQADAAYELATAMQQRMPEWAAKSWRWRIVMLRAEIDHTLKHDGRKTDDGRAVLRRCTDELTRIYHADRAEPQVRPPVP